MNSIAELDVLSQPTAPGEPRRVIVIDDNPDIQKDFRTILLTPSGRGEFAAIADDFFGSKQTDTRSEADKEDQRLEYKISSALQGKEGVEMITTAQAEGKPFALAFVDMRMPPGWDGIETIENLWRVAPNTQVVICTAYSDYSYDQILDRLGGSDRLLIIKKPFDPIEVAQLARALTGKWCLSHQADLKTEHLASIVEERTRELENSHEQLKHQINEREKAEHEQSLLAERLHQARKLEAMGQLVAGVVGEVTNSSQQVDDSVSVIGDALRDYEKVVSRCGPVLEAAAQGSVPPDLIEKVKQQQSGSEFDALREKAPQALKAVHVGLERIEQIVQATNEFAQSVLVSSETVDVNRAIENTVSVAQGRPVGVGEVKLDFDPDIPQVACEPGDLEQVILNLLSNAVQATADRRSGNFDPAEIRITSGRDGNEVVILVADSGCGIPVEIQDQVFEPNFSARAGGDGNGRGLAVAHDIIVNRCDGRLSVSSEIDKGSTFEIRLPIQ